MLIYLFLGVVIACLLLMGFEWASVYHPAKQIEATPADLGLAFTEHEFVTQDDKRITGWWIPHHEPQATILYCHGNSGNIGDRINVLQSFHQMGYEVFIFDYRGYGRSKGIPSEKGTAYDVEAAYEMTRTLRSKDLPVILYGRSLGGAVACQLAMAQDVDGIIFESTFTSIPEMGQHLYPFLPKWASRIQYNTVKNIGSISCPILIAHSQQDGFIPYKMGKKLRNAAHSSVEWMELKASHGDHPFETTPGYDKKIQEFVSKC